MAKKTASKKSAKSNKPARAAATEVQAAELSAEELEAASGGLGAVKIDAQAIKFDGQGFLKNELLDKAFSPLGGNFTIK